MIYHSIPEYIRAKSRWENQTAVVTADTINGLPVKQFYKANSKPRFEQPIYENPDGTKVASGLVAINKKRDTKIK